jgi:glucose-6-phosphate 1-dehydrogenase
MRRADPDAANGLDAQRSTRPAEDQSRLVPADPCAMVLFGATGDLARRLVIPALYDLESAQLLPDGFTLVGVARARQDAASWRDLLRKNLDEIVQSGTGTFNADSIDDAVWTRLAARLEFVSGDLTQPALYHDIAATLDRVAKERGTGGNAMFYLAVADRLFGAVVDQLAAAGLTTQADGYWRRVVIEKPFGHDLASAKALNAQIAKSMDEAQVFRIDHFLGKDTVQNILALRFANGIFEPLWNRERIDHVQITAAETVGVEQRAEFYEATGALRDMMPNHLLSLLTLIAMEPPVSLAAEDVRTQKAQVLAAIAPVMPDRAVRGQYGPSEDGKQAAYRAEDGVALDSVTETYAAIEVGIDNWRWSGVPFYLRTGKHLAARVTEIAIRFNCAPQQLFSGHAPGGLQPNWLVMRIAPDESISVRFQAKRLGPTMSVAEVRMDFHYHDWFEKVPSVGYEILLHDVMNGDQTLFMRTDMVEHGWRILQPLLDAWAANDAAFPDYPSGSEGPEAADALIARTGDRSWRPVTLSESVLPEKSAKGRSS